jgi:hypothetical protein
VTSCRRTSALIDKPQGGQPLAEEAQATGSAAVPRPTSSRTKRGRSAPPPASASAITGRMATSRGRVVRTRDQEGVVEVDVGPRGITVGAAGELEREAA